MIGPWVTAGLALSGCAAGAVAGWVLGRRYRSQPINALFAILVAFAGGCYVVWLASKMGDARISAAGLGVTFGVMTGLKYSSGLIPGLHGATVKAHASDANEPDDEPDDPSVSSEEAA